MPTALRKPLTALSTHRRSAMAATAALVVTLVAARPSAAWALVTTAEETTGQLLTWWKAAILGIVEGVTEYLPISSTGHLLITTRILGLPKEQGPGLDAVNTYVIAIQFGAILAVLGLFWRRFWDMLRGLVGKSAAGRHLLIVLVIAFLPSAALGAVLDKKIEKTLFGPWPVVVAWIVGGVLILVLERTGRIPDRGVPADKGPDPLLAITYRQALIIGLAQCVALWPGTSRSLATILAALLVGVAMPAAVEFSFILGVATLTAATGFKLVKDGGTLVDQFGVVDPLIGAVFAFAAAVIAVKWMITYLQRHSLSIFAWYRFIVAGLAIVLLVTKVI